MPTERTTQKQFEDKFLGETKVFVYDFSIKLNTGDTISSIASITITNKGNIEGSEDITVDTQAASDTEAQVTYLGGTVGEYYETAIAVNTANGERLLVIALVRVT